MIMEKIYKLEEDEIEIIEVVGYFFPESKDGGPKIRFKNVLQTLEISYDEIDTDEYRLRELFRNVLNGSSYANIKVEKLRGLTLSEWRQYLNLMEDVANKIWKVVQKQEAESIVAGLPVTFGEGPIMGSWKTFRRDVDEAIETLDTLVEEMAKHRNQPYKINPKSVSKRCCV